MKEVKDYVKVLKRQYPIDTSSQYRRNVVNRFWDAVEKVACGENIPDDIDDTTMMSNEFRRKFSTLPQFKSDSEACIHLAGIVKRAVNREDANYDLFILERRLAILESRIDKIPRRNVIR